MMRRGEEWTNHLAAAYNRRRVQVMSQSGQRRFAGKLVMLCLWFGIGMALMLSAQEVSRLRDLSVQKDISSQEADAGGSWGEPVEGFRLSVRLPKPNFTNGEPVTA